MNHLDKENVIGVNGTGEREKKKGVFRNEKMVVVGLNLQSKEKRVHGAKDEIVKVRC